MKSIFRTAAVLAVLLTPVLASAAFIQNQQTGYSFGFISTYGGGLGTACTSDICYVASTIIYIINSILVPVLFAIAFIVFLYGIARAYIFSHGEPDKVKEGHHIILWGIIAFVVMISVWGLVNVVSNTFGLGGSYAPSPPYSPYMTSSDGSVYGQQPVQYVECPRDANGNCK